MIDALVTHSWNRIGYNICRSLGSHGLQVAAASDTRIGMSSTSRYTFKALLHPPIQNQDFLPTIIQLVKEWKPKVLIPSCEDTYSFSKHLKQLRQYDVIIPVTDFDIIDQLNNKNKSAIYAKSLGIPAPETIVISGVNDIRYFAKEYGFPVVLKPIYSNGAHGVLFLEKKDIDHNLEKLFGKYDFENYILQNYIQGEGYGVSMLMNHGRLRAKFTHKRIREKYHLGGPSTIRISTQNKVLEEYAEVLLSDLNYHGVAMVEFKLDEKSGKGYFIEVNPRFWGSLGLAIQAGVNFPLLLYQMAVDGDIEPVLNYQKGLTIKWLLGDILAVMDLVKATNKLPSLQQIFYKTNGYDDFFWDDIVPFFSESLSFVYRRLNSKLKPVWTQS